MNITKATRWRVFAGVWIQSLFTSATAFFSLFCLPLCNLFDWSTSDFSMAYTIYMFIYCAVGFIGGILAEKLQPRVAIYIGLIFFAGGWILTGFANTIPFLYIAYGVIAGAGAGMIYPACLPTALKWFPDKSGSISGLVQAGAACGPFIMSPVAQMLIDYFGPQSACQILGVIFLIGVGAVAWMIVPCPEGWQPEGWHPSPTQSQELQSQNYNIPQMIKKPVFWVLLIMFIFANAAGTMMVSATSPIAQNQIGLSAMDAALCVSLMTLFNMFGRISFGFIYDKLKGWNSLILVLLLNGISMLMLTIAKSYVYFIICIALVGFSFGGLLVVFAPMVKIIFGSKYYNRNYGLIFIGYGIGAFIGPKISASFYDATGSYMMGYLGSAILAAAAILLVILAKKMTEKMSVHS
ncbi:OFA family MFS transporter [Thomasclavelia saccharogumia]|uniref:L-lactate MFS transporter n=1 Tax=Thomasclavelia saccharogumia TaxID=341225 RepID=UPI00047ABEFE|nr:OFA family MFS transporter [Thomasclavelia saccharogumia]